MSSWSEMRPATGTGPAPDPVAPQGGWVTVLEDDELLAMRRDRDRAYYRRSAATIAIGAAGWFIAVTTVGLWGVSSPLDVDLDERLRRVDWQLGLSTQDAYVAVTALVVLVATISIAVVASGRRIGDDDRDAADSFLWGEHMSAVSRIAASFAVAVALTRWGELGNLLVLFLAAVLASRVAAATMQRDFDQLPLRLRLVDARATKKRLGERLSATGADVEPTGRLRALGQWLVLISATAAVLGVGAWVLLSDADNWGVREFAIVLSVVLIFAVPALVAAPIWAQVRVRTGSRWAWLIWLPVLVIFAGGMLRDGAWRDLTSESWLAIVGPSVCVFFLALLGAAGRGPYLALGFSPRRGMQRESDEAAAQVQDLEHRVAEGRRKNSPPPNALGRRGAVDERLDQLDRMITTLAANPPRRRRYRFLDRLRPPEVPYKARR